ncbi:hypothetical protein H4F05_00515 [Vibrio cholerae]
MEKFQISYFSDESSQYSVQCHSIDDVLYFSLVDIVGAIGARNKSKLAIIKSIINTLDDDEYIVHESQMLVTQPGLYRILSTDLGPKGKKFQRWIMHEVIPSVVGSAPSPDATEGTTCSVFIDTDGSAISLSDFVSFLTRIDCVYKYAVLEEGCATEYINIKEPELESAKETASKMLGMLSPKVYKEYASKNLPSEQELKFVDIRRHNPIELVFSGISIALVVALIISGGKFELGFTKLKIELPPLGEGVAKLKNAFKSSDSEK